MFFGRSDHCHQWFYDGFLMLLPSLSMVFNGSGPLVKRCDGFDGSLWSRGLQLLPWQMVLHKIERKVIPNLLIVWYLSPVRSFLEEISNWQLYLSSSPKACSCDQHLYWGCLVHLLPNWFVLNPESWSRSPSPFS